MSKNRLFRAHRFVLAVAAVAGFASGAIFIRWTNDGQPALARDSIGNVAPDARLQLIQQLGDGSALAMLWTSNEDLWFVTSKADGRLVLQRYSTATTVTEAWDVPLSASQTIYTFMAEDSQGRIWIAANYAIVAFDPLVSAFAFTEVLDKFPADLAPEARTALPFEGSWIAGMMADSEGRIYLVRQSTKALFHASIDGIEVAEVTAEPPTTVRLVGGRARPIVQEGDYIREAGGRSLRPFFGVDGSTCGLNYRAPGEGAQLVANGKPYGQGLLLAYTDPVVVQAAANRVALGVGVAGSVFVADCTSGQVDAISLGSTQEFMEGLYGGPDVSRPVENRNIALALALSPGGRLAMSTSNGSIMIVER